MMLGKAKWLLIAGLAVLLAVAWAAAGTDLVSREQGVDNTRLSWGFVKRGAGKPPLIDRTLTDLADQYGALYMLTTGNRTVALTFNLGYEAGYTDDILKVLEQEGIRAAFFVTGHWLETAPALAKQVVQEGHLLGNHSWSHKDLTALSDEEVRLEIMRWDEAARDLVGDTHGLFRPPAGVFSERVLKLARDLGYSTVFWTIAIVDWVPMEDPSLAVRGVVNYLHDGAIIMLHGTSQDVAEQLEVIVDSVIAAGYRFRPLLEPITPPAR